MLGRWRYTARADVDAFPASTAPGLRRGSVTPWAAAAPNTPEAKPSRQPYRPALFLKVNCEAPTRRASIQHATVCPALARCRPTASTGPLPPHCQLHSFARTHCTSPPAWCLGLSHAAEPAETANQVAAASPVQAPAERHR